MLNEEIFSGIVWGDVLKLLAWVIGSMLLGKALQLFLSHLGKLKRFENREIIRAAFQAAGRPLPFGCVTLGLYFGLLHFEFSDQTDQIRIDAFSVLITIAIAYFAYSLVAVLDAAIVSLTSKTQTKMDDMLSPMIRKSLRAVVWIIGLLRIGQILSDKPLTSILTGLGVGGLAVALAAQETIKHFFGSMVIFADKPFELGDRVVVNGHDGVIEEVGFRSTRIRTLEGHLVTAPNGELANQMIQNIGKRPYIRRLMNVTITYDTPPHKVQEALEILRDILKDHEGMREDFPPRVYFNNFNESSLNIFAIYWYHPPAYWDYLAHAEKVNMELLRRYNEAGIEFAFPTQTLYVNGIGNPPPAADLH